MAESTKKIDTTEKPKKKRKILSRLILFFTAFLLFLVLLVSITQTRPFKNWLSGYVLDKVNEQFADKDAKLTFRELDGNFFSEVILTDAVLHVKNDDMVKFDKLKINFDIFKLLDKRVEVKEVLLQNPVVNFVKVQNAKGDSLWNFAYLFSSDKEKDTSKSEFEWKINVQRLRIENLNLTMLAVKPQDLPVNALKIANSKYLDISNLKISKFTLETTAYYDKNGASLEMGYLGFNSNFGFDLKGLSGNFFISRSRAEVNKLNIETSRSWMQMEYVFIDKLDLMNLDGLESFKGKEMRLNMVAKKFDTEDIKCFLEPLNFLAGKVYLELKCDGKFDDIKIDKCILRTDNSDMNFHGRLMNLIDPPHLSLDVAGDNLTMDPADTKAHVPGLPIPDYSYLGKVKGSFTYKGEPTNFQTTYDIQSSAGDAKGYFNMNLTTPAIDYSGFAETRNGNIGKVLRNEKLESNLNGKVEFKGSGFSLANIHTKLTYEMTASKFAEYSWESTSGTIDLNNYNINADLKYLSKNVNAQVNGTVNVADFNNPKYDLKGKVANLNIAAFTKNQADKSNINAGFDVKGSGYSMNNLEGDFKLDVGKSYYGKYDFPETPITLKVSTGGIKDNVIFTSNIFDFKADGKFKLEDLASALNSNLSIINNQIRNKFNLDTLLPERTVQVTNNNVDFKYEFKTKNADAITKMFFFEDLDFSFSAKGYIRNTDKNFETENKISVDRFSYRDSLFTLKNAELSVFHNNNYSVYSTLPKGSFESFDSDIKFNAEKIILSKAVYDSLSFSTVIKNGMQSFKASGKKDTSISFDTKGLVNLAEDSVTMRIEKAIVSFNRIDGKNDDTLVVSYQPYSSDRRITFENFSISGDYLKVDIGGYYSILGESDIYAEMGGISIPAISELINDPGALYNKTAKYDKYHSPLKGNIRRILMSFKGTQHDPKLSLEMNTGLIRYENTKIGRVDAFVDFSNKLLSTDVLVSNSLGQGSLRLTGDVPFNNPLEEVDSSSYYSVLTSPMNIKLKAKDFQLNFFSKLIPNFTDIKGFLNGELTSTGTVAEPQLAGGMNIEKGRFFLTINNLYYRFATSFRAENSDLVIENFKMFYVDDNTRHLDAYGKINFAGLRLNYIDISTSGDIKVLDRSSRLNRFGFYGDMIAGIGSPAITIKGDFNRLYLEGELVVKQANLIFPSLQGLEYNVYADDFIYRILNDSTGSHYLDTTVQIKSDELDEVDPFLRYKYELANKPTSIADNLVYDLHVKTDRNVYVSINFNELTKEELFGEITADLRIQNKENKEIRFDGSMQIVGDSYYRIYYKNFKIENSSMQFEGPYDNPDLHINAKYKNIRTVANGEQEVRYVVLAITGTKKKPELSFSLQDETGANVTGNDAKADALSYLIFGVPQNNIDPQYRSDIFSNLGNSAISTISSSYLTSLVREVAPFILNTEVIYQGGNLASGTDIRITSEIGDAIVRFGGKVLTDLNNAEVSVQYPLNKLFNMNISNNLLLEIKREYTPAEFSIKNQLETSVGVSYKINF